MVRLRFATVLFLFSWVEGSLGVSLFKDNLAWFSFSSYSITIAVTMSPNLIKSSTDLTNLSEISEIWINPLVLWSSLTNAP